ncbi:alkaline phosphatase D family protein [Heyndrickxia acidiproducens]|uniref:alkaline phosphatase D family protein n=1 Tax=Heyndrickxia acidiproducens TaxID=1121084 RepID=UPI000367B06E|nr:alkaline phosphatase D family protein [Heyndrickxia acidiproducens]
MSDPYIDQWIKRLEEESFQNHTFDRRKFIEGAGKIAVLSLGLTFAQSLENTNVHAAPSFSNYPFTLGVASGDPMPESVVLWTRLAPDPLNGGGMPNHRVPVKWEIAKDNHFRNIIQRGTEIATPELAHTIHAEVNHLEPNHVYYYRFKCGNELSPAGRTKTLPHQGANISKLSFAFTSCQQYEHGFYTAHKHLAGEDLDLVFHLGDYIYEYGPNEYISSSGNVRTHNSSEIWTLDDYRNRYAQYRSDADLKSAHAAFPWVVTWDDHEVENNYANNIPEKGQSVDAFIKRRTAAYQAYYENMPLRRSSIMQGNSMKLYRDFTYGNLASFFVLDSRQYRDDQANGDGTKAPSAEQMDPARTLLGNEQEKWLLHHLGRSKTSWNVLAQQIFFSKRNLGTSAAPKYSMDAWDGYPFARKKILDFVKNNHINNLIVLSGDVHANWATNILSDFDHSGSKVVGAEFVGTSVTSGGNGSDKRADTDKILRENPHIKFFNNYRGYVTCTVTPDRWKTDYRVLPYVTTPGAEITTRASFIFDRNSDGIIEISTSTVEGGRRKSDEVEEDRTRAHERAHKIQIKKKKEKQSFN